MLPFFHRCCAVFLAVPLLGDGAPFVNAQQPTKAACLKVTRTTKLQGDVCCDCDDVAAVIEVVGPASLDLNGFTVKCDSGSPYNGVIWLTGNGAKLSNGIVTGLDSTSSADCLHVGGSGGHTIRSLTVLNCEDHCIRDEVDSHINAILYNHVDGCGTNGIQISGDDSKVVGNTVSDCNSGIRVDGSNNLLTLNQVSDCCDQGIEVTNEGNKIHNNAIEKNRNGILLKEANFTSVVDNKITDSSAFGVLLLGVENDVGKNTISGKGQVGIGVFRDDNHIGKNAVTDMALHGILIVEGIVGNTIAGNKVSGSGSFDLMDSNIDCSTNTWRGNVFISDQTCSD